MPGLIWEGENEREGRMTAGAQLLSGCPLCLKNKPGNWSDSFPDGRNQQYDRPCSTTATSFGTCPTNGTGVFNFSLVV